MGLKFTVETKVKNGGVSLHVRRVEGLPEKWDSDIAKQMQVITVAIAGINRAVEELTEAMAKGDEAKLRALLMSATTEVESVRETEAVRSKNKIKKATNGR